MSHGEYSPLDDEINLDDDEDRTGLDASPVYPSSPLTQPRTLDVDNNAAFADPTEESQDSTNAVIIQKRKALLRDLLIGLDAVVYIELAALYFLDNSTTFFALRSLVQLAQITSILTLSTFQLSTLINGTGSASSASTTTNTSSGQVLGTSETTSTGSASASATAPSTTPILDVGHQTGQNFLPSIPIPKPGTTGRPNILLILALNALCLFVHFFTDAPTASEVTRFYMHGSIIIDFIGQRAMGGWTSKMRLCAMDLLVAALQVTAIGVVAELLVKKDVVKSVNVMSEGRAGERVGDAVRRFWEATGIGSVGGRRGGADVEMQPLRDGRRREDEGEEEEEQQAQVPRSPMDMYNSGQAVVADLNLVDTVRQQFWELRNTRLAGQV